MTKFGKALRKLCLDAEVSQAELAKSIGCSSVFITAVVHGRKKVSKNLLEKIADFFKKRGVHVSEEFFRLSMMVNGKVDISDLSSEQQWLVARLARSNLSDLQICRLEEMLKVVTVANSRA